MIATGAPAAPSAKFCANRSTIFPPTCSLIFPDSTADAGKSSGRKIRHQVSERVHAQHHALSAVPAGFGRGSAKRTKSVISSPNASV